MRPTSDYLKDSKLKCFYLFSVFFSAPCARSSRLREEMRWYHEQNRPARKKGKTEKKREGGGEGAGEEERRGVGYHQASWGCLLFLEAGLITGLSADPSPGASSAPLHAAAVPSQHAFRPSGPVCPRGCLPFWCSSPSSSISWCRAGEGASQSVHRILENPFFLLMLFVIIDCYLGNAASTQKGRLWPNEARLDRKRGMYGLGRIMKTVFLDGNRRTGVPDIDQGILASDIWDCSYRNQSVANVAFLSRSEWDFSLLLYSWPAE